MFAYTRAMGSDNRDWYRDWWRKRTGYAERAAFRIGHDEHRRAKIERKRAANASAWRRNLLIAVAVVLILTLVAILR